MRTATLILGICLLLAPAMAGCVGSEDGDAGPAATGNGTGGGPDGPGTASAAEGRTVNVTTPHPVGEAHTETIEGTLTPDEAHTPFPAAPTPSCCFYDWNDASSMFSDGEIVQLRVTLNWTNTEDNNARLDIAADVPWWCCWTGTGEGTDLTMGDHTATFTVITRGDPNDDEYLLGVRYNNAVVTTGLDYTIDATAIPLDNTLAIGDPYLVDVPAGVQLSAELVGPLTSAEESSVASLLWFDEDDRPFAYTELEGGPGTTVDLDLPNGSLVVVPMIRVGTLVRLTATVPEGADAQIEAVPLEEEFDALVAATVPDPAPADGTEAIDAEPGTFAMFPWFDYAEGVQAQNGLVATLESRVTLSSSNGVIVDLVRSSTGAETGDDLIGQFCFSCYTATEAFDLSNILDDDGNYDVAWSSEGAAGEVLLFTSRYVRP